MKKLDEKDIKVIVAAIGGDEVRNAFTALQAGEVKLDNLTVVPASDQPNGEGGTTHINEWVRADFVRATDNQPAGSASLRSILISPDIKWDNKNTQTDRIKALIGAEKMTFTYMEARTSKSTGNPYKVAHFVPQTL